LGAPKAAQGRPEENCAEENSADEGRSEEGSAKDPEKSLALSEKGCAKEGSSEEGSAKEDRSGYPSLPSSRVCAKEGSRSAKEESRSAKEVGHGVNPKCKASKTGLHGQRNPLGT
jgi:hypothetical protein